MGQQSHLAYPGRRGGRGASILGVTVAGSPFWGGARSGGLEFEFQLEFDSVEVVEFVLGGAGGCPLKAVKFQSLGYAASNFTSDATRRGQTLECLN